MEEGQRGCFPGSRPGEGVMISDVRWYYAHEGRQFGPVSSRELRNLAVILQLSHADLIRQEGKPDWVPAGTVAGLFPTAEDEARPQDVR